MQPLINRLGLNSYEYVDATTTYTEAVQKLENVYSKKINKIYARWKLTNEKQREGEFNKLNQSKSVLSI